IVGLCAGVAAALWLACGDQGSKQTQLSRLPTGPEAHGADGASAEEQIIDYGCDIFDVTKPYQNPSLYFYAYTRINIPIYWVEVSAQAFCREIGQEKWLDLVSGSERRLNSQSVRLSWTKSFPFSWEAKMYSQHGWKMDKFTDPFFKYDTAGPVQAKWVIERVAP
ncbi:MAG: hypothetical protein ACUVV3_10665, partial [Dehalococcoidia bacterium]